MKTPTALAVCLALLIAGTVLAARTNYQEQRKIDAFTGTSWESAMTHLDNLALEMQNQPQSYGVVFVYGGQKRRPHEANAFSKCLKDYLVMRRSIDVNRLVFVNGGYRQDVSTEFWMVREPAQIPKATPTITSAAVRFKGKRIAKWRSLCSL